MENAEKYPLVSVIIPTYNRVGLLKEAIDSVLAQSFRDFEIIVADDGSGDDTEDFFKQQTDPRIRFFSLLHSGHPGLVRNRAVVQSKGKWLAFLDSDDLWLPGKLESQVALLNDTGYRWSFTAYSHSDGSRPSFPETPGSELPGMIIRNKIAVYVGTLMVEKNLFRELGGFSESMSLAFREDLEFILRLSVSGPAAILPTPLTTVRLHEHRSTSGIRNAHEVTSRAYDSFIANAPPPLKKVALKRQAYLLSEAAAGAGSGIRWPQRINLMKRSFRHDNTLHWLHCLSRALTRV